MDLTKALFEGFATFLGGAAATVLFLMPGYVMSKSFSGGVRGLAPTDRAFLATTASGGLLTHLLVLWWTVPLFRSISDGLPAIHARQYLEVLLWAAVVLAILPAVIGAECLWGTRFVASSEAWVHERHKQRLIDAGADDTIFGRVFTVGWPDAPHRALRNKTVEEWEAAGCPPIGQRPGEGEVIGTRHESWGDFPWYRYGVGMVTPTFEGDLEHAVMWAGDSVSAIHDVKPAGDIVRDLAREAEAALAAT